MYKFKIFLFIKKLQPKYFFGIFPYPGGNWVSIIFGGKRAEFEKLFLCETLFLRHWKLTF